MSDRFIPDAALIPLMPEREAVWWRMVERLEFGRPMIDVPDGYVGRIVRWTTSHARWSEPVAMGWDLGMTSTIAERA